MTQHDEQQKMIADYDFAHIVNIKTDPMIPEGEIIVTSHDTSDPHFRVAIARYLRERQESIIRRAVIEELAREAEEHENTFITGYDISPSEGDEDLLVVENYDVVYWHSSIGKQVAAWLRAHVEEEQ